MIVALRFFLKLPFTNQNEFNLENKLVDYGGEEGDRDKHKIGRTRVSEGKD